MVNFIKTGVAAALLAPFVPPALLKNRKVENIKKNMELKISFFDFGVDYVASREKLRQNTFAKWSISFRLGEDNKVKFP